MENAAGFSTQTRAAAQPSAQRLSPSYSFHFLFFAVHPVICPAQQHFHIFGSRFPDGAHGGTHLLPPQCFPELLHFGIKFRFRDPRQDHDKLVSADPVRLLRKHFFQEIGHPADQPVARLVPLFIVGLFQTIQVDEDPAYPLRFRLFPHIQAFDVAITVVQMGQRVRIAEVLQIQLLIALFQDCW